MISRHSFHRGQVLGRIPQWLVLSPIATDSSADLDEAEKLTIALVEDASGRNRTAWAPLLESATQTALHPAFWAAGCVNGAKGTHSGTAAATAKNRLAQLVDFLQQRWAASPVPRATHEVSGSGLRVPKVDKTSGGGGKNLTSLVASAMVVVTQGAVTTQKNRVLLIGGLGTALPKRSAEEASVSLVQASDGALQIVAARSIAAGAAITRAAGHGGAARRLFPTLLPPEAAALPLVLDRPFAIDGGDIATERFRSCKAGLGIALSHELTSEGSTTALLNAARLWRIGSLLASSEGMALLQALNLPNRTLIAPGSEQSVAAVCERIGSVSGPFAGAEAKQLRLPPKLEVESLLDLHRALSGLVARARGSLMELNNGAESVTTGLSKAVVHAADHSRRGRVRPNRRKIAQLPTSQSASDAENPSTARATVLAPPECQHMATALKGERALLEIATTQIAARIAASGNLNHLFTPVGGDLRSPGPPPSPDRMRLHVTEEGTVAAAPIPGHGINMTGAASAASVEIDASDNVPAEEDGS